jgi:hypothetical protein
VELKVDDEGFLNPEVRYCDIDLGQSYLYHDVYELKLIMHQFIRLAIVIIKNASYFMGDLIFGALLGPVLDVYLEHYTQPVLMQSVIPGQGTWDVLTFDYRNMESPYVNEHVIEFSLMGDTLYNGQHCRDMSPGPTQFLAGHLS